MALYPICNIISYILFIKITKKNICQPISKWYYEIYQSFLEDIKIKDLFVKNRNN